MESKLVYIAHPISGDVAKNIQSVLDICREVHLESTNIVPFAPYITTLQYLKEEVSEERALGLGANTMLFERRVMDELWLCGDKISGGMIQEILLCIEHGIFIRCYNQDLYNDYVEFLETLGLDFN